MTITNLWVRLKKTLDAEAPLLVGKVNSVSAFGAVVELPDGALVPVRGDATVGQSVFIRSGIIEGVAPELPVVLIEI